MTHFWHSVPPMGERRLKNARRRLEEEAGEEPRGILEIFAEPDDERADADTALTRADEESGRQ